MKTRFEKILDIAKLKAGHKKHKTKNPKQQGGSKKILPHKLVDP